MAAVNLGPSLLSIRPTPSMVMEKLAMIKPNIICVGAVDRPNPVLRGATKMLQAYTEPLQHMMTMDATALMARLFKNFRALRPGMSFASAASGSISAAPVLTLAGYLSNFIPL